MDYEWIEKTIFWKKKQKIRKNRKSMSHVNKKSHKREMKIKFKNLAWDEQWMDWKTT